MFFLSILKLEHHHPQIPLPALKYASLPKINFEISVQRTYLKKLGPRNAAGVVGDVTEKYCFILCTIKSCEKTF